MKVHVYVPDVQNNVDIITDKYWKSYFCINDNIVTTIITITIALFYQHLIPYYYILYFVNAINHPLRHINHVIIVN